MIDFHMHSTASDGVHAPEILMRRAGAAGVRTLALTDHDTFGGFEDAAAEARKLGMDILPAAEVSTTFRNRSCHILAFFGDRDQAEVTSRWLAGFRQAREDRLHETCERFARMGIRLTPEQVHAEAGPAAVHRPHIARALVKTGAVKSPKEAFDRFLHDGGPAYVPYETPDARSALWLLREQGAYTSLAHPAIDRFGETDIRELAQHGLHAVEVYHSEHRPADRRRLRQITGQFGLGMTGGSDYHGDDKCSFYTDSTEGHGVPLHVLDSLLDGIRGAREQAPHIRRLHGVS